jgi:hypothetical protein
VGEQLAHPYLSEVGATLETEVVDADAFDERAGVRK